MSADEKLSLTVAMLALTVGQLMEQIERLRCEVQDLKDIFRGCACFGTGGEDEKQDADGNLVTQKDVT